MRLGARRTIFSSNKRRTHNSVVLALYKGEHSIMERHRHRYEVYARILCVMIFYK